MKILVLMISLTIFLSSCSSKSKTIVSFVESDLGVNSMNKLMLKDEKTFKLYLQKLDKKYKRFDGPIKDHYYYTIEENLGLKIDYSLIGNKTSGINFIFSSSVDELDKDLVSVIKEAFNPFFDKNKNNKNNKLISYEMISDNNQVKIYLNYNYYDTNEKLKNEVKKSLNNIPSKNTFILNYFDEEQVIPKGKIWIIKELQICRMDSSKPDSTNLKPGKQYRCNSLSSDDKEFDIITNKKCIVLEGNLITDNGWQKFGFDITPVYNEYDVLGKYELKQNLILFPEMTLCVSSPNYYNRRVLVQEVSIKDVKGLDKYLKFNSQFDYDIKSFDGLSFLNLTNFSF